MPKKENIVEKDIAAKKAANMAEQIAAQKTAPHVGHDTLSSNASMFNPTDLEPILFSLKSKIAWAVGGALMTDMEIEAEADFDICGVQSKRDAVYADNSDETFVPRSERLQFWRGFTIEHNLDIKFDEGRLSFDATRRSEMNEQYKRARASKYNRDLSVLETKALVLVDRLERLPAEWERVAPRYDYTAAFEGLLYTKISDSIESARKSIDLMKFPYDQMSDEEIDGTIVLLDALETQVHGGSPIH